MISLVDYLNEAKESFVKFSLYGCDNSKKVQSDVASIAQKNGIYFEETDNGFKLKVKSGQNVDEIVSKLNELIDSVPEDKKEECQATTDKIKSAIEKLQKAVEENDDENDKEENTSLEESLIPLKDYLNE